MTKSNRNTTRLYGLDTLRAYAILSVLLFHYQYFFSHPKWLDDIAAFGWSGVDLFFVLSGYLIASQLMRELERSRNLSFKRFYIKRSFRILPPFLVVLAVYVFFPSAREKESLAPIIKYLTFTQNIGIDPVNAGTFSHAWSLCIEEQFYLILPILLISTYLRRSMHRLGIYIGLLAIAGVFVRLLSWYYLVAPQVGTSDGFVAWIKWIYYPTQCRLDGLLVGVFIAWIFQYKPGIRDWLTARHTSCLILGLALFLLTYIIAIPMRDVSLLKSVSVFPLLSVALGFIVIAAISPKAPLGRFNASPLAWGATLSYSVYLSHKIVFHLTQKFAGDWGLATEGVPMLFICLTFSFGIGLLMHFLIERPSHTLRNKALQSAS